MSLPRWALEAARESMVSNTKNFTPLVIQALSIAWAALVMVSEQHCEECHDDYAADVMQQIEDLHKVDPPPLGAA